MDRARRRQRELDPLPPASFLLLLCVKQLMLMTRSATLRLSLLVLLLGSLLTAGCSKSAQKARHLARAEKFFAAEQYDKATIEYFNVLRLEQTNTIALTRLARIRCEEGLPLRAMQLVAEARLKPDDPVLRRVAAEIQLAQGDRAGARAELQALLAANPTNVETLLLYVRSAAGAQEVAESEARLREIAQATANAATVQFAQAMLLYRQGQAQQSEQQVQQLLQTSPNLAHAHAQMAQFHLARTNLPAAAQSLAEAARLAPTRSLIRIAHATSKATPGQLGEARSLLTDMLKKAPDYYPALLLLARIELQDKKAEAALELTSRALRLDPLSLEVRQLRTQIYIALAKTETGLKEWEQFDSQVRPNALTKLQVAQAFQQAGDPQKAAGFVEQAIRLSSNRLDPIAIEANLMKARLALGGPAPGEAVPTLRTLLQRTNLVDAQLLLVEAFRRSRRLPEAVTTCRNLVQDHPKTATFPFVLGVLLREQGTLSEARAAFQRSLELAPGNLLSIYQLVDMELAAEDQGTALRLIQTEMARQTNSAPLKYLEGRVYAARRQWPQAEASLKQCLEWNPNFSGAYQMLSSIYVATTNLAGAAREMEQLVARQPKNARARMMLATIYEGMDDTARARESYDKILANSPDFVPALNNLAYLHAVRLKGLDRAYALAQKANRLAPEDAAVADTLGWVHYLRGDHQKAQPFLVEASDKAPGNPVIQFHLGMNSYMLAQPDTARKALERAVASAEPFKEKEEARRRLALLGDSAGSGPQGLAELESRVQAQPRDLMSRSLLAERYERDGQPQKAALQYEEILRQNSRAARAALGLAILHDGPLNNRVKALEFARKASDLAPDDPEAAALLGRVLFRAGDYSQAYSLLQVAAPKLTTRAQVQFDAAWAAFAVGRLAEADQNMRRALQAEPGFKQADAAKWFAAMTSLCLNPQGLAQGEAQIRQLLEADPNHAPALFARAGLLRSRGDSAGAAQAYQKVLDQFRACSPAARELALIWAADPAQSDKAYQLLVKTREAAPDDSEIARALGILCFGRKEYSRTVDLLKESLRGRPADADALYYQGRAQFELKLNKASADSLRQALALNLKPELAEEARRILSTLQ